MWDRPVMRWVALPAIFVAVGPPAGGITLLVIPLVMSLLSVGVLAGLPMILPLILLFSYPFGGFQALLTGLVAAATVRRGGRVRAAPTIAASLAIGLAVGSVAAVASGSEEERGGSLANAATMVAIHLAGGLAGLAVCRWVERRGMPPGTAPGHPSPA